MKLFLMSSIISLYNFLVKLKSADPGFGYKIFPSHTGASTGYVDQTLYMGKSLDKYGNFLSFDIMKRKANNCSWPYFGPIVIECNNYVRVVGKAFMLGETHEAYCFVINTLLNFTPGRLQEDVLIIAGDCVLNDTFLTSLNLPNAKLIWDQYHLMNHIWKYGFQTVFSKVEKHFYEMIDGYTKA